MSSPQVPTTSSPSSSIYDVELYINNLIMATTNVEILVGRNSKDPNLTRVKEWDDKPRRNIDFVEWEEGDEFVITGCENILSKKIGKRKDGTDITVQYIVVDVTNPRSYKLVKKNFYPADLTKIAYEYNRSSKLRGMRKTVTGTVVDHAKTFATIQELMNSLKGKKIRITRIDSVFTLRFGCDANDDSSYYEKQLPQYDFVEAVW